jgi:hypothetical protein
MTSSAGGTEQQRLTTLGIDELKFAPAPAGTTHRTAARI